MTSPSKVPNAMLETPGGGGGSAITVKDEGTTLTTTVDAFNFVGAGVTATNSGNAVTVTIAAGGDAQTSGKLSQFAATTSNELAGTISDETGTGQLVFATGPSLVNPLVGTQTPGDNTNKAASTAFTTAAISAGTVGLLDDKGSTDCSANPNYPAALKGDTYTVSVAGKIGGASGTTVTAGAIYRALADNAGGTQAGVGASWTVLNNGTPNAAVTTGTLAQFAATTSAQLAGVLSDETGSAGGGVAVFNKAPTFTADPASMPGAIITSPQAITTALDFNYAYLTQAISGSAPTMTVSNTPATGQSLLVRITGDTVSRVVTLPAGTWRSTTLNATITTFTVPANWQGLVCYLKTAAGYDVIGEPQPIASRSWNRTQTTGANETKTITAYAAQAGTITAIYGKTVSGTISVKVTINGTDVTGATCTAASTRATGAATAANTFVAGDVIAIVYSSNSSAVSTDVTVLWTPSAL